MTNSSTQTNLNDFPDYSFNVDHESEYCKFRNSSSTCLQLKEKIKEEDKETKADTERERERESKITEEGIRNEICLSSTEVLYLLKQEIESLFIESYDKYSKKIKTRIFFYYNHSLYRDYENYINFSSKVNNEIIVIDNVFIYYLEELRRNKNKDEIKLHIKLLLLFREFLNIEHEKIFNLNKRIEYTATQITDDLPQFTNKFLDSYLEVCENIFDIGIKEGVLITSEFCEWLFINNHTQLKLVAERGH